MNRLRALLPLAALVLGCSTPANTSPPTLTQTPTQTPTPTRASSPAATVSQPAATATSNSATPAAAATAAASLGGDITLVTHDSFAASDSVIGDFQRQTGVRLNVVKGGDAGAMVNQAILTKSNPLGDALYGVDTTFLSRALDAGIFVPYVSPASADVASEFKLDAQNRVTPIDYGDVCVVYDVRAVGGSASVAAPATINDLTKPEYHGSLVVENPATSSPGLAFMLATVARFGETGEYTWLDYWRDLRANDLLVSSDWNDAYYNEFSGAADPGTNGRPFVVSYATDPASSMVGASDPNGTPGVQFIDDGCMRQIEFAAVLAGAKNPAAAQAWIDFMASVEFQSDMPLNMYVLPVNPQAQLPGVFTQFTSHATAPLTLDPATIAANRDRWIQEWTDAVIH
jgi:thiamine transport system substrate-binding protein